MAKKNVFTLKELENMTAEEVIDKLQHKNYSLLDSLDAEALRKEMVPVGKACNTAINYFFRSTGPKYDQEKHNKAARKKLVKVLGKITPGSYDGMPKDLPNGLVIGTCAIIKNNREINFIIDGYEEKFRDVYSSYLIKWEIIKKYMNEGYTKFNLGEITANISKENNKFYGLYLSKAFFNGKIIEYPGEFDLVINKLSYSIFYNKMYYKNKKIIKEFNKNFKK